MELHARLVHAEPGSRVVEVTAHRAGTVLGSALGEADSAETAEERAIARLLARLGQPQGQRPEPAAAAPAAPEPSAPARPAATPAPGPAPIRPAAAIPSEPATSPPPAEPAATEAPEPLPDPDDWSSELAGIDLELRRLGWQRDEEATYLERAFAHPSRSRLTSYSDVLAYLQALQALEGGSDPTTAAVPLRRRDLLNQCDQLLGQLQWDAPRGRAFLERHFERSSRQQLSDSQLLQFNMLLEGELISA